MLLVARSLTRRVALVALVGSLALGTTACKGSADNYARENGYGEDASEPDATFTIPPATTTVPDATTTPTSTTTTAPAAAGLPDAEAAAQGLYDAWKAGDKVAAAKVADPAAIDGMWLTPPGDYALYNHCDTGEFDFGGCLYRGDAGTIQIDLEKRGGNWVVAMAFYADV